MRAGSMKKRARDSLFLLILLGASTPAWALGPVDGEVGVFWWASNFNANVLSDDANAGALGGFGELWWDQKWGLRGALYRSDLKDLDLGTTNEYNLDFKRRLVSLTDNTFLAAGVGYERLSLDGGGHSSGPRLVLEGRLGVVPGIVYLYGETAWLPSMSDASDRSDIDGSTFEAGLSYEPLPFFSIRAGYRTFKLDFQNDMSGENGSTRISGFLFGGGFHW